MRRLLVLLLFCIAVPPASALTIYTEDAPPASYESHGKLTGYAVELVQEMQRRLHDTTPIELVPWARGYHAIRHAPNVAMFAMARTLHREAAFHWVGPIGRNEWAFYKRRSSPLTITSMEDAKQMEFIAVYRDDARDLYLLGKGFTNLQRTSKNIFNIRKLLSGRVDLIACSRLCPLQLELALRQSRELIEEAYAFKTVDLYLAFSKGTPEATALRWQEVYEAMVADGTFQEIYKRWLPGMPSPLDD